MRFEDMSYDAQEFIILTMILFVGVVVLESVVLGLGYINLNNNIITSILVIMAIGTPPLISVLILFLRYIVKK